eukprot:3515299-Rhodomonas_salina.1
MQDFLDANLRKGGPQVAPAMLLCVSRYAEPLRAHARHTVCAFLNREGVSRALCRCLCAAAGGTSPRTPRARSGALRAIGPCAPAPHNKGYTARSLRRS